MRLHKLREMKICKRSAREINHACIAPETSREQDGADVEGNNLGAVNMLMYDTVFFANT